MVNTISIDPVRHIRYIRMKLAERLRRALDEHKPHGNPGYGGYRPAGRGAGHPVDRMLARGTISEEEYAAACRFRAEYEACANRGYGKTVNWDTISLYAVEDTSSGGRVRSERRSVLPRNDLDFVVDTIKQIDDVFVVVGPLGFQVLRAVAVMGIPLISVSKHLSVHRDVAAFRFREALECLTDYYGSKQ